MLCRARQVRLCQLSSDTNSLGILNGSTVAEIVGCSIATAKIRIHRGRRRLKQALNEECTFYRDEENVFRCDRKRDA